MKTIVIYFSAETGKTRKIAEELSHSIGADLFEIRPEQPYSASDLKWMNPLARCNKEKLGKKDVPVISRIENWGDYDTVYLGFPIWYY
ncbi:MAG: flavodoxin, partial [Oscillospiraceae bacterium]|nr:flavodoxin [Oscillospiraceae bacterium]